LRSRHASADIEASRRARIPSPPAEPPVLVLWLNQVTRQFLVNCRKPRVQTPVVSRYPAPAPVHDFVLLFLPPCGPHLTPLTPSPSCQAYLSLHSSEAPQGIVLSRPFFTCTNANQAATCTCNTRPRVNPHHVVNHLSQPGETIHRSSDAPVLNGDNVGDNDGRDPSNDDPFGMHLIYCAACRHSILELYASVDECF
jgi:hypothetical protein